MGTLVAGVDSSTQSCKVVVRDVETGRLVRSGSARHPDGTEVHPEHWWTAFQEAAAEAGGLDDVAAISVGGQQHGMVCLDAGGEVVRPALLWNDTRSAQAAADLDAELGEATWAQATGSVLVASFTITKLRWLRDHEPAALARTAAVCLPHDWLTWRIAGSSDITTLVTDRSEASGTGYWSAATSDYRTDLLERATGRTDLVLPRVLAPAESGLRTPWGALLGAGVGDNAGAALGIGARPGDVILSIGTSGVVSAVSPVATADVTGTVAGFADATGHHLPLVATLNAAQVLASTAGLLGVDFDRLSELALSAPAGADGLVLVPYFGGERTPNLPHARGALHGMSLRNLSPAHVARAAVEGLLCGLADGIEAMTRLGVPVERVILIGGGARSQAVREIAPTVLGRPVVCPAPGEYVADGAARQAAWVLTGSLPEWELGAVETYDAPVVPLVREQYAAVSGMTLR